MLNFLNSPSVRGATHAVARILIGLLFMQHGAQKLFGVLGGMGGSGNAAELFSLMGLAGVLEFFGGLLVVAGLWTAPIAALLALQMLVAYFMAHAGEGLMPIQNNGELALLYMAAFAFLAVSGSGPASLDMKLRK